jgi:hypothetical protein
MGPVGCLRPRLFPSVEAGSAKAWRVQGPAEFMDYFISFAGNKASVLMVEEDHKFFREKRGPVAMVSIDNYGEGWRVEPQFDFFHWATPRQRLASVISFPADGALLKAGRGVRAAGMAEGRAILRSRR